MRVTSAKRSKTPDRWTIGVAEAGPGDGVVALTLDELRSAERAGAWVVRFDELLAGADIERANDVLVRPSMWRGHSFITLCEWIVCARLARPGSQVRWEVPARGGATGVRKVLTERGWEFAETRGEHKRQRVFEGPAPDAHEMPAARSFVATLGSRELSFAADWGVFSLGHVDDGTRRLFDAAHARSPSTVADVGTGYGAVAIGLAASGAAPVLASDVDLVALHLARCNADANRVRLDLRAGDDPAALEPAELTTCEIATHVSPAQTERLVSGLAARARMGPVLVAVHNSLVARYQRLFVEASTRVATDDGDTHAILTLTREDRTR